MLLTFKCSQCDTQLEVSADLGGTRADCPHCGTPVTIPPPRVQPGSVLGNFHISEKLGEGGMGEVFLANQVSMDRQVALKVLPLAMTRNKKLVDRFIHEVRMSARLEHANIVTAFEAGEDTGYYYLAMSYVDGESLDDVLKRDGAMPEKSALEIVERVADALRYAWDEFKILHRDIKPANIMLDHSGKPRLMDMGISKSLSEDTELTMTGMVVGTPHYMSPEQARSQGNVDFRADLYSLGATLYHLVTGTRPYAGTSVVEVLTKHALDPFPPPQSRNPDVSDACAHLLEVMMAKDANDRQATWGDLITDIQRVGRGQRPLTRRPAAGKSVVMSTNESRVSALLGRLLGPKRPAVEALVLKCLESKKIVAAASAALILLTVLLIMAVLSGRDKPPPDELPPDEPPLHLLAGLDPDDAPTIDDDTPDSGSDPEGPPDDENTETTDDGPDDGPDDGGDGGEQSPPSETDDGPDASGDGDNVAAATTDTGLAEDAPPDSPPDSAHTTDSPPADDDATADPEPPVTDPDDTAVEPGTEDVPTPPVPDPEEAEFAAFTEALVGDLMAFDFPEAMRRIAAARLDPRLEGRRDDISELSILIARTAKLKRALLDTFRESVGWQVEIVLKDGTTKFFVRQVDTSSVSVVPVGTRGQTVGLKTRKLTLDDLAPAEKIKRMSTLRLRPGADIFRAALFLEAHDLIAARSCCRDLPDSLAVPLMHRIDRQFLQSLVDALVRGDYHTADERLVAETESDSSWIPDAEIAQLASFVSNLDQLEDLLLGSFRSDIGSVQTIGFKKGKATVMLTTVKDEGLAAKVVSKGKGSRRPIVKFTLADVGVQEKVKRVLPIFGRRHIALLSTVLFLQDGELKSAQRCAERVEGRIKEVLLSWAPSDRAPASD